MTSLAQHHFLVIIIDESQRVEIELGALDKEREKDKAYVPAADCRIDAAAASLQSG